MVIHDRLDTNEPISKIWPHLNCNMEEMKDSDSPILPDVSIWLSTKLLLSEQAYQILEPEIRDFGEFLPITADGYKYYIFHCLTDGFEDESKMEYEYFEEFPVRIISLAFVSEDVEKKALFKSSSFLCNKIFCNDKFKALCEENNLKGLRFEEDLNEVF